ncbi:MAG: ABC transporter permease subunit [Thermoproteota archaeon]
MLSDIVTLVRKDLIEFRSNKQIWVPVILLPLIISIGLPITVAFIPSALSVSGVIPEIPTRLLSNLPEELREALSTLDKKDQLAFLFISYYFAPTFLVIPLAIPAVLCADSFAGEKERKTIEAILATPMKDSELLVGKMVLPLLASLVSSYTAFSIYSYLSNVLVFRCFIFPTYSWILIMSFLVPALTFFSVGSMIIVSARSKGFKEAQQVGGMIVLPVFVLLITQLLGIMSMTSQALFETALILYALDAILFKYGSRAYSRDHLMSSA